MDDVSHVITWVNWCVSTSVMSVYNHAKCLAEKNVSVKSVAAGVRSDFLSVRKGVYNVLYCCIHVALALGFAFVFVL